MLIVEPGAVSEINISASVDSFIVTWVVPKVKTGPTDYFVEVCPAKVNDCEVDSSCEVKTVKGVFADEKNEMHAIDKNVLQSNLV